MPTPAVNWIEHGVLANLIRPRAWALKTTAPATAAVDNLILEDASATASQAEMIAATERGLLLTTLWYIRAVDPQTLLLTGLTRDGVFLVEGGEVTGAVNNFRFNESPVDFLAHPAARVERLVHPRRDADAPGARLQHEQRQPGELSPRHAGPRLRVRRTGAERAPRSDNPRRSGLARSDRDGAYLRDYVGC
jgi:predicted Zn-dependent protease